MAHTCKALVIHCMDFRFHTAIREFLISTGLEGQYDLVSLAGAAKGLVEADEHVKPVLLKQIQLSKDLHNSSDVYLIHHMDCGAYGGHDAFASLDEEYKRQTKDLQEARDIIEYKLPGLTVHGVLARIKGDDKNPLIDFEIVF